MSLDQLLFECTRHYRDRGFPESALMHLRWVLITNTCDGQVSLKTPYPSCNKRVDELLGHFKPCTSTADLTDLTSADAIFAFSFGYRMKHWSPGVLPTDDAEVAANRIPGANNAALAEQARQLHMTHGIDLYLQFEIADALGPGAFVECISRRVNQGTRDVLTDFVSHANKKGMAIRDAVAVAHRHHYDRCELLLKEQGICAVRPTNLYSGYDPFEAQPRVMSPAECIVNDFASMAGMIKPAERRAAPGPADEN